MTTPVIEGRFTVASQEQSTAGAQKPSLTSAARVPAPPSMRRPAPRQPEEADRLWADRLHELLTPSMFGDDAVDPAAVERTDQLLTILDAVGYPTEIIGIFAGEEREVRFEFQDDVRFYAVSIPADGPFHYSSVEIDGSESVRYDAASDRALAGLLGLPFTS